MNHKYKNDNGFPTANICENCGIIRYEIWNNSDVYFKYYLSGISMKNFDIAYELDRELTCEEIIIKNIIE